MPQVDLYELKRGEGSPLIGVHGAGGILFMGRLAPHLGAQQPFYALHGRGLDRFDREPEFTDIQQLAAAYADAAAGLDAGGPVFVCGRWGPIVLETGRQMHARGLDIGALIVFDAGPGRVPKPRPVSAPEPGWRSSVLEWIKRIPRMKGSRTRLRAWRAKRSGRVKPSRRPDRPFGILNGHLLTAYQPRRFPGRVFLIFSEEFANKPWKQPRVAAWRSLCDEFQMRVISGGHTQLFHSPHIEQLGSLVQEIVDDVKTRQAPDEPQRMTSR